MKNNELKVAVIRQELVELTGCYKKAIILNQFIYWHSRTKDYDKFLKEEQERGAGKDLELRAGWIYKSAEELAEETMLDLKPSNMRKHIRSLVDEEWLQERRNPKYRFDRTLQYRINSQKIINELQKLGYNASIGSNYRISVLENGVSVLENRNTQNEKAIPEITTEITSKTTKTLIQLPSESEYVRIYSFLYHNSLGKKHPRVTEEQLEEINHAIGILEEEDFNLNDYICAVKDYFDKLPPNNNGNILAFIKTFKRYFDIDLRYM